MTSTTYNPAAPRSVRRAVSRQEARRQADAYFAFMGMPPRYQPAHSDTCGQHHRKQPCARCPETATA